VSEPAVTPVPSSPQAGRQIDAVIFDFGGVLASNGRPTDVAKRFPNDPVDKVMKVMMGDYGQDTDHPWHRLERGEISMLEYRDQLAPLVLEAGLQMSEGSLVPPPASSSTASSSSANSQSSIGFAFEPNHSVIELVHELKSSGFRLGVLTNNVRELRHAWWPMLDFANIFDDVVDSHEVGMRKPNRAIYELALNRLGVEAHRAAFLDDAKSNVDAASALGIHGIWVDVDPTQAVQSVRQLANL
jgi:epoxide hydrolase-like predicted phosphatase